MRFIVLLLLSCFSHWSLAAVHVEPSRLAINDVAKIRAGEMLYYQLALEKGTQLRVRLLVRGGANNKIALWLVDLPNYLKLRDGKRFTYLKGASGTIEDFAGFKVTVPTTNNYYLVLDNTRALVFSRTVQLTAYEIKPRPDEQHAKEKAWLEMVRNSLGMIFEAPEFDIRIGLCGTINAYSAPDILLCRELIDDYARRGIPEGILFVLLHEYAHSLLRLWNYPLWDNEDAADEMATVLAMMIDKKQAALQAASKWAEVDGRREAIAIVSMDDRHTLSPQRARNIIRWLNKKPELYARWFRLFVPHLTTPLLERMIDKIESGEIPASAVDPEQIRFELQKRKQRAKKSAP